MRHRWWITVLATVFLSGCLNYEALQRASESQAQAMQACHAERTAMWQAINGENVAAESEGMMVMAASFASVLSPCGKGQTNAMDVMVAYGQMHRDLALGMVPLANTYFQWRGLEGIVNQATGNQSSTSVSNMVEVSDEASYSGELASNVGGNQAAGGATQSVGSAQGGSILDSNDAQLGNTVDQRGGDGESAGDAGSTTFNPVDADAETDVF